MRELLFRNITSLERKRSELLLSEHFEESCSIQDVEKRMVYCVKETLEFTDPVDLVVYIEQKKKEEEHPHTYLVKTHDTQEGIHKFIYKIVGEQFVVVDDKVFVLKVVQSLKRTVREKRDEPVSH
ncbi:MAG: hypothetical protein ABIJ41_05530 [Candidatus Omnitrophota bacterium]